MEKLLQNHTNQLDVKVEDAIARAQTPAPAISDENMNLKEQVWNVHIYLGWCKLENEILKEAKNAQKWHFWVSKWSFLVNFQGF